ncbi:WD-40 repeat protein [Aphelenchoides avenae]|nr:WD-40 repeat protein [Aphelenchus avenae]KAH7726360.1 WD-40 repeat protein [Aphelenchus avenae]
MVVKLGPTVLELYTEILDQCFSPNESDALVCDDLGRLFAFSLTSTQSVVSSHQTLPLNRPVNCVKTVGELVVCGGSDGFLSGYRWSAVALSQQSTSAATAEYALNLGEWDINDICVVDDGRGLLLGCGDGIVRMSNVEVPNKVTVEFNGHAEQVNQLAKRSESEFLACSNDGTVTLWDIRASKKPSKTIRVKGSSKVIREDCPVSVYSVAVDGDFLVCGGGVDLGLWHISSESLVSVLQTDTVEGASQQIHSIEIADGQILAGGTAHRVYRYNFVGEQVSSIDVPIGSIRSIHTTRQIESRKLTLVAGQSSHVHFLLDFGYLYGYADLTEELVQE